MVKWSWTDGTPMTPRWIPSPFRTNPDTSPRLSVSVVVPCYNYGHYLPMCIASILDQPGVDVDILIVDDASPDGSGSVADALAASDSRVRVHHNHVNLGHIATYTVGLRRTTGDLTVLLSADDLLAPGALARAAAVFQRCPSVGLVYGHPRVFTTKEPIPAKTHRWGFTVWRGWEWIAVQSHRGRSIIYSPEAVVRTTVLRRVGDYNPDLPHSADMEMWLRVADISDVARVNGCDQAYRRHHDASMMHTTFAGILTDLDERARAYSSFFGSRAGRKGVSRLWANANRQTADEALEYACDSMITDRREPNTLAPESMEFARTIYPRANELLTWKELQALTSTGAPSVWSRLRAAALSRRRGLRGRLVWRRWYLAGY